METTHTRLVLAPMAGITDWPFRLLAQKHGADELVSEMISAMGLLQSPKDSQAYQNLLASHPDERRLSAQLFGRDPEMMARAAAILSELPQYCGIDINFGCPAPKVTNSGSGSALMRNLPLARDILRAVRKAAAKPLSVKMRIGWDAQSVNAVEFSRLCEDEGADSICVHGRTRAQQYAGKADWSEISRVKQAVKVPVIANGDVFSPGDALAILAQTGADGIAIGRGALGNPWLFRQIRQALSGQPVQEPTPQDIQEVALTHLRDMVRFKGEHWALVEMRKHFGWYLKGSKGAAATRAAINRTSDLNSLLGLLRRHFEAAPD